MSDDKETLKAENEDCLEDPGYSADEIRDKTTEEIFNIGMGTQDCDCATTRREAQTFVALIMRTQGHTYDVISSEMGVSKGWAHRLVMRGIKRRQKEPVETIRQMQIDRLEKLLAGCWDAAEAGDPAAVSSALAVMDRIDKAHGIEPPKRIEHTFTQEARADALDQLNQAISALPAEESDTSSSGDPSDRIH